MFFATCIYAQSAEVITDMLQTKEVTYGQICYLSAIRQNLISEDASYEEAVYALYKDGQLPYFLDEKEPAYLVNISYIYTKMLPSISGGAMFKLTKGSPRYAFKLLKADGVLSEKADPYDKVSGFEALGILTSCMIQYGSEEECMDMDIE